LKRRLFVKLAFDGDNEADVARDVELDVKGRFVEDSATPCPVSRRPSLQLRSMDIEPEE